jgi:copper chaperone CopZ
MMTEQVQLKIGGMGCDGCVNTVKMALEGQPGVANARVDLASESAVVEYASNSVTRLELVKAVEEAGYTAE